MEDNIYDVYICYSRKDLFDEQGQVNPGNEISKILQALTDAGISYWIDKEGFYHGDAFSKKIIEIIKASRIFLFLSTHNSNNSDWTANEIAIASVYKKLILPIRVDDSVYSDDIMLQIVSLEDIKYYENPEKGLLDLINAIKNQLISSRLGEECIRCAPTHTSPPEERDKHQEAKKEEEKIRIQLEERQRQLEERKRQLERERQLKREYRQKQQSMIVQPNASCPPPNSKHRSLFSGIVSSIASLANGVASGASYVGKKIKSVTDKTNVSYSALTNDFSNTGNVLSSVFAPAEVRRGSPMLVQVYLHLPEETGKVQTFAQEADKDAKRRDYIPLQCQLKKGDKVDVLMNIYGETLLMSDKKSVVWQGSFTKCSFDYLVPKDIDVEQLSCKAMLSVNGYPVGEMIFITKVVEKPRQLNPEIFSKQYQKIFISYAHQDEPKVEQMARAYKAQGVDYFFDRHYLQPGDVFPLKIQEFIDSADLFILCWSVNAANSDYVDLERKRALERAYPKIKPIEKAPLRIYPMSIEPRAELPADMRDTYNFDII